MQRPTALAWALLALLALSGSAHAARDRACTNTRLFPFRVGRDDDGEAARAARVVARAALASVSRFARGPCRLDDDDDDDDIDILKACKNRGNKQCTRELEQGKRYRMELSALADYDCRPAGSASWRDVYLRFTAEVEVTEGATLAANRYRVVKWNRVRQWVEADDDDDDDDDK